MIEIIKCENCNVNPAQHLDNLCDPCEQAMMEKRVEEQMAEIARVQAEQAAQPVVAKKSNKRK